MSVEQHAPWSLSTLRVLVAEDERIVANDIEHTLRALGHTVCALVDSGSEAIESARLTQPDLALLDIHLQGDTDGIEAATEIRERLGIPVVFLTAYADRDTLERAARAQPHGYVRKPFNDKDLEVALLVAIGTHRAFAETLRVQAQLREAEQRTQAERMRSEHAEAAIRERDEFISVASHELRTPLTALLLKLEGIEGLLQREPAQVPVDKLTARVTGAMRQARRLGTLIDGLLEVSKGVSGQHELRLEQVDLGVLTKDLVAELSPASEGTPVEIAVHSSADLRGNWDRSRVRQVMSNLLSNALKFGGRAPITVTLDSTVSAVRVVVRDRGIGIAPKDAERIFERFQRAAPSSQYGGLGLGLYMTRHAVEAHGGSVHVESQPGQGSAFVVSLPRTPPLSLPAKEG